MSPVSTGSGRRTIPFALFVATVAAANFGCTTGTTQTADRPGRKGGDGAPVMVATAVQKDVPVEIQVIGNVEPYSVVTIRAQVTGQLREAHFREGEFVKKDDLLFTIDPSPFEASVRQAEANLAHDKAQLNQAEATLKRDIAQQKYAMAQASRYRSLFKEGIASKDQTEQIQAGADALSEGLGADEAMVQSAKAQVGATEATLQNTRILLGYTTIRSPIEGRTGNIAVKMGNLVTANTTDLVSINQVQPAYVTFSVPEPQLPAIRKYMAAGKLPVSAAPQDGSSAPETGTLSFIDNSVDTTTGTIKLKATFTNTTRKLWPGEFVRVTLRLTNRPNSIVIPNQALQTGQDGPFVYVVKADKTVESRPVVPGSRIDQEMVIESGLRAGDGGDRRPPAAGARDSRSNQRRTEQRTSRRARQTAHVAESAA